MIEDYRANRGIPTFGPFKDRDDILLLTTVGAKTGEPRIAVLAYSVDDGDYFVIASKGGSPDHPGWYHNLIKNPRVTVEVHDQKFEATAHVATGEERDRLYAHQANRLPSFWDYQKKTDRQIPVIVLKKDA